MLLPFAGVHPSSVTLLPFAGVPKSNSSSVSVTGGSGYTSLVSNLVLISITGSGNV